MTETSSKGASCPICGKPSIQEARPFCSRRCADIDLGRWLKGTYRVPTDERADPYDLGEARRDDDD